MSLGRREYLLPGKGISIMEIYVSTSKKIFFDSRYRRYYRLPVFALPRLQPSPRPVIQSITSSRSSSQSRLRYSVAVSRYPCPISFAGA